MIKKIFLFVLFVVFVTMFGVYESPFAETRSKTGWRIEKTASNPILSPDDKYLFPNSDFELGDWTSWTVVAGTAWINKPAGCAGAPNNDIVFGIPDLAGGYRTACSDNGGDAAVGVLASQAFTVRRKYISFISAGWDGIDGTFRRNRIELIQSKR